MISFTRQVAEMVRAVLSLEELPPEDAADALYQFIYPDDYDNPGHDWAVAGTAQHFPVVQARQYTSQLSSISRDLKELESDIAYDERTGGRGLEAFPGGAMELLDAWESDATNARNTANQILRNMPRSETSLRKLASSLVDKAENLIDRTRNMMRFSQADALYRN